MKKSLLFIAIFAVAGLICMKRANAGGQANWGTSTGGSWRTPDDTIIQNGQALVVTSSVPYPTVGTSSTTFMGIASFTLTQINNSTPSFVGEIAYCSNCTNTMLVVSSGTTTAGSFAGVYIATGSGGTTLSPAK